MPTERSPRIVAADFNCVIGAYREKRRQGERHDQAFLTAVRAYRRLHPDVSKPAAAHAVTQMMRGLEGNTAA